jgi:hypothetical protein
MYVGAPEAEGINNQASKCLAYLRPVGFSLTCQCRFPPSDYPVVLARVPSLSGPLEVLGINATGCSRSCGYSAEELQSRSSSGEDIPSRFPCIHNLNHQKLI